MKLSKDARKTSKALFQATMKDGAPDEVAVRSVVAAVIARKPRHFVQILKDFRRRLRLEVEKTTAVVESAETLTPTEQKKVTGELRARHGAAIDPRFTIKPELLGGLRIRIGSDVWDGSVSGRLERLGGKL